MMCGICNKEMDMKEFFPFIYDKEKNGFISEYYYHNNNKDYQNYIDVIEDKMNEILKIKFSEKINVPFERIEICENCLSKYSKLCAFIERK